MQSLLKFRVGSMRFVRTVMGKPYMGEEFPSPNRVPEKKESEKFTKAFQAYLDSRLTLEDMMKAEPPKKPVETNVV